MANLASKKKEVLKKKVASKRAAGGKQWTPRAYKPRDSWTKKGYEPGSIYRAATIIV